MPRLHSAHLTLLERFILFIVAFCIALLLQMGIGHYQSRYILSPLEERTENIQSISQFINSTQTCMTFLSNQHWGYDDNKALAAALQAYLSDSSLQLDQFRGEIRTVSEGYYLLSSATQSAHSALSAAVAEIATALNDEQPLSAAQIYYNKAEPYGSYLLQYSRQLLELAIFENHDTFLSAKTLNNQLNFLRGAVIVICALLGSALALSLISLLRSVSQIAEAAQLIGQGHFDTPDVDETRQDEIGNMAKVFNDMKHSTKRYVDALEEKTQIERELRAKETESLELQNLIEREKLQHLRSQMDPHFLFNTLNMINYIAKQEKAEKTNSLIISLSQLLRYSLGSNDTLEPLSKEVQIVNSLYALYHVRFEDRMVLQWHISPQINLTETLVPPFIIQPLVENAFKHGLSPKEGNGLIDVDIRLEEETLCISVSDNGVGMSEQALQAVRLCQREVPSGDEHLGLYNIDTRLRLLGKGRLELRSSPGTGTTATIRLPLVTTETKED